MRIRRRVLAVAGTLLGLTAMAAGPAAATWSIVGVDRETGEVGVAIASCVRFEVTLAPTLVPGQGAAVSQAGLTKISGNEIVDSLDAGESAQQVVSDLTSPSFDSEVPLRQYGVVTLTKGAAGFTGIDVPSAAMDLQNKTQTASAQGVAVDSQAVVTETLEAFDATSGKLGDRLMAALSAGSKAGGDADCVEDAAAASLLVARKGEGPYSQTKQLPDQFQAFVFAIYGRDFAQTPPQENVPSTFISVITGRDENAVTVLANEYSQVRADGGTINKRIVTKNANGSGANNLSARLWILILAVFAIAIVVVIVLVVRRAGRHAERQLMDDADGRRSKREN